LSLRLKGLSLGGAVSRDETQITNLEFRLYREQGPQSISVWNYGEREELAPARGVTYREARNFCAWLNGRGNERFRLPDPSEINNAVSTSIGIETLKFVDPNMATGYWLQGGTQCASNEFIARTQAGLQINVNSYLYLDDTKGDLIQAICQCAVKLKPHVERIRSLVNGIDPDRPLESLRAHSQAEERDPLNLAMQHLDEEWKHEMAYAKTSGWECARDLERTLEIAFDLEVAAEEVRRLAKPWSPRPSQGMVLVRLFHRTLREFSTIKSTQQRSRARVTFVICAFVAHTMTKMSHAARSRYVTGPKCSSKEYALLRDNCLEAFWVLVLVEQRIRSPELNYEGIKIVRELIDFGRSSDE
jgi:hypothetical protein